MPRMVRPVAMLATIACSVPLSAGCGQHPPTAAVPAQLDAVAASSSAPATTTTVAPTTSQPPGPPQLPRGGTTIFPKYRVVAYYGTAGTASLGVLGDGPVADVAARLDAVAAEFATADRTVQPAMELIVTIADRKPGPDGDYSHDINPALVWQYLEVARAHKQLLVLDVQPGRSHFLPRVREWEPLLREPDVGLALDPEWRMPAGQVPGHTIGQVRAAEINEVSGWLAELTRSAGLPQKLLVLHQFTRGMMPDQDAVVAHPELAIVQHVDGFGSPAQKLSKYQSLQRPDRFHLGFKLFYDEDTPMLGPAETLALQPPPDYVSFQ